MRWRSISFKPLDHVRSGERMVAAILLPLQAGTFCRRDTIRDKFVRSNANQSENAKEEASR